jgi:hypothetical protein
MKRQHNLKLVEPSLPDQLEAAIVAAASVRQMLDNAETEFREKYPDDHRLMMGEVLGMVLVDSERDPADPGAPLQPRRTDFLKEREAITDLQWRAKQADGAIDLLRIRVESAVTEQERRSSLAGAIAEAQKADTALQNLRASVARADNAVADAEERHGAAVKAVTTASEAHARLFEAAIEQGHPPGQDSSARDARRAADDAADEVAVAKAGATALKAKLGNAEQRLSDARAAVVVCANSVAVAGLPQLLAEAERLQGELEARRLVLSVLDRFDRKQKTSGYRSDVDQFLEAAVFPYTWNGGRAEDHQAAAPWLEAVKILQIDADAPLPAN